MSHSIWWRFAYVSSPAVIAATSVLVPPMSKVRMFSTPSAQPRYWAPSTPATGPDISVRRERA